jgi:hypothetical protein
LSCLVIVPSLSRQKGRSAFPFRFRFAAAACQCQAITQVVLAAGSQPRYQVARAADSFADLSALPTGNAAEAIRNVALDVLIDYDGAHDYNNMELLALRMAPVQVRARPD